MRILATLLLAVSLVASACSDDDGNDATGAGVTDEDATGSAPAADERDDAGADDDPDGGEADDATGGQEAGDTPGGAGDPGSTLARPQTLAVEFPRLAERLCALDPRVVVPSSPSADAEELRELVDATRDSLAELQSAVVEVEGGAALAALVDDVVDGWTAAVSALDAGEDGDARDAIAAADAALDELHQRADVVLAACGDR